MTLLVIEPFYGGSHKQLIDLLRAEFSGALVFTLPATKWHWRARTSAVHFAENIPVGIDCKKLFCSSVLNLAEFVALRPDIAQKCEKIVYFHENQLVYPIQDRRDRDFQYGYNQILTCLVADKILFNSKYNLDSLLNALPSFVSIVPSEQRPKSDQLAAKIMSKSAVLYFPLQLPAISLVERGSDLLHIVWPHRWEHDKNAESFYEVLFRIKTQGIKFRLSLLGEQYDEKPEAFVKIQQQFADELHHVGFLPTKNDYFALLQNADVVVSTAIHEFFGVAMLEAVYCGCYPLCPNRLVYPEIFPSECLYNTDQQLFKALRNFCKHPNLARTKRKNLKLDFNKYSWSFLREQYTNLLKTV